MNSGYIQCGVVQNILLLFGLVITGVNLKGTPVVIDFEGLPDSTIVTTQYPGLTFTNAIILTSGISLNEFEFPPHSGVNVVSDNGGPITIDFSSPITSFGGYFTYLEPLTVDGFNAANSLVASAASAYSTNDALFGDPGSSPNEFIQVSFTGGISSIMITGDPAGESFALDDATFVPTAASVPETATGKLVLIALAFAVLFLKSQGSNPCSRANFYSL